MRKALKWIGRFIAAWAVIVILAPFVLGVLAFILLSLSINTNVLDHRNDVAIAALEASRLPAYTEYAPTYSLDIKDCMTLFTLSTYDNHIAHTDLHASIMAQAAITDDWHVESLPPEDYAARIIPETTFLQPAVTFDAWFESAEAIAFFDKDSGLFAHQRKAAAPKQGSIHTNGMTIPHNGYLYEMETPISFRGDGISFQACIVPETERPALEQQLAAHADWYNRPVTNAEYRTLQDTHFLEALPMYPAENIHFEWCSFVDTYARHNPEAAEREMHTEHFPAALQEIGAQYSLNWLIALYDPDTGLFICYQSDS